MYLVRRIPVWFGLEPLVLSRSSCTSAGEARELSQEWGYGDSRPRLIRAIDQEPRQAFSRVSHSAVSLPQERSHYSIDSSRPRFEKSTSMALVDSVYHPLSTDADDWSPSLFVPQRKHFQQRSPLQYCTLARPGNNSATTSGPTFDFSGATRSGEKIFSKQAEGKGTVQGTDSLGRPVEETMRGETERGGSGMTQQGKDAARELGGAAGVAEEDWARIETLFSGPSRVKASTSSLGGDRATSSPSSSRLASPPPMDAIADSYFSTINFGLGPTHAQNGAFHIPPLSRPPSNGKGKDRAHDDSPPFPSDSPGLPPPVHDAHESPYSCLQSASAAPIRFRRVGALGISVSSSSGEPSSNDRRRKGSSQRGWSDEDRRRSAQDRCEWGEGSNGSSGNLDSAGGFANGRVDQPGVSEAGFRGIVDELALQSESSLGVWRAELTRWRSQTSS